jgi:4-amino-4-deoxy-L-arabinose transferase-like glycosyltransferase
MDTRAPSEPWEYWQQRYGNAAVGFGHALIFQSGNDPRRVAFWSRLPILGLGTALVISVFFWGRRLYGPWPALGGSVLCAFGPNLIAHAGLATEDLGCAALMFLATWTFWLAHRDGGTWRWVRCGLVTGLAFVSKYTALLLAPVFLAIAVLSFLGGKRGSRLLRSWIRGLGIVGGVSALVVGLAYGPRLGWLPYLHGIQQIYGDLRSGYDFYLAGDFSASGWWYYALAALAFKVSLGTLLLIVLSLVHLLRGVDDMEDGLFVLVPAAAVVVASFFDGANLGLRRILPALPFLYLFAGRAMAWAAGSPLRPARLALVLALLGWTVTETVRIYPHHLSFISAAAGGPLRGPYLLDDSNIDWGQDLPALADWQRRHPEATPLRLLYFGTASPRAYGVEAEAVSSVTELIAPRPGTYAISAHWLVRLRHLAPRLGPGVDWLRRFEPVGHAGYSIFVYDIPQAPRPRR